MRVVDVSARVISQSFTVAIVDNDVVECDETFIVTILSVTTCAVTIGNNNSSEVIITDDDSKWSCILSLFLCYIIQQWIFTTVSLSQSQYSVAENDTSLTVSIALSSTATEDVVVEVTLSDGTANGIVQQ